MKNMQWLLATLLVVLVASGCGGGGGGGSTSTDAGSSSALRSISVTPSSATLAIGGTQQLTVTGVDSSGKSATLTSGLTFTTPAATILSVSGSGLITAVAVGNETVTVKSGDLTATANLLVFTAYFLASKHLRTRIQTLTYVCGLTTVAAVVVAARPTSDLNSRV
jgi:uncharacterized protein YjdB